MALTATKQKNLASIRQRNQAKLSGIPINADPAPKLPIGSGLINKVQELKQQDQANVISKGTSQPLTPDKFINKVPEKTPITTTSQTKTVVGDLGVKRAEPVVATVSQPVKTVGVKEQTQTDFETLSDRDKQIELGFKTLRNSGAYPELSDAELKYMIGLQIPKPVTQQEITGGALDQYKTQIAQGGAAITDVAKRQEQERAKLLEQQGITLQNAENEQARRLQEQGLQEKQTTQDTLSFSGFGRSTEVVRQKLAIDDQVALMKDQMAQARQAELASYERQLQGEDRQVIQQMQDQVNALKQNAQQLEVDSALKVAELNAQNNVMGAEALSNILQVASDTTQKKVNKEASELLGYVSDEFGNPILTDDSGNPVPIPKEKNVNTSVSDMVGYLADDTGAPIYTDAQGQPIPISSGVDPTLSDYLGFYVDKKGNPVYTDDQGNPVPVKKKADETKWERWTDEKTGKTFFYDPTNPAGTMTPAPVNNVAVYTDANGNPIPSITTDITNREDVTEQIRQQYGDEFMKYKDANGKIQDVKSNCAEFVRKFVPNMPGGNGSKQARIANIQKAKEAGFGSDDMSTVQVGDAILTGEGTWGHSAMVIARDGDTITLLEANYPANTIATGRTLNINDKNIYGWVRPNGTAGADLPEIARPGLDVQLQDAQKGEGTELTSTQIAQAGKIAKDVYGSATKENIDAIKGLLADGISADAIPGLLGVSDESKIKPLSGADAKLNSLTITGLDNINSLRELITKELTGGKSDYYTYKTNRDISTLINILADKVGRIRSGGAINSDEAKNFRSNFDLSLSDIALSDNPKQLLLNRLKMVEDEFNAISSGMNKLGKGASTPQVIGSMVQVVDPKTNDIIEIPSSELENAKSAGYIEYNQ